MARSEIAAVLAGLTLLAGCDREERQPRPTPVAEAAPVDITLTQFYAGDPAPPAPAAQRAEYEGNAYHVSEGQRLYRWFNCDGCHFNGGGGIGPALMDETWRYGGELEQIYASIVQGRPNGMPSFRGKIPEQQVWQLAAYVRSLSGRESASASAARSDHMAVRTGEARTPAQPPRGGDKPAGAQGTGP